MFKRINKCVQRIRNLFRKKNKVQPLISEATEPENIYVPTPVHLFQVPQVRLSEARTEREEPIENVIETQVESVKERVEETIIESKYLLNVIAEDTEDDSDHGEVIEKEAVSSSSEDEAENPPDAEGTDTEAVAFPSDACTSASMGSNSSITDDPIMIEPSPGAILIAVQEAKTFSDEPKPLMSGRCFLMASPGSESTSISITTSGSETVSQTENLSEESEEENGKTSELQSDHLVEEMNMTSGNVSALSDLPQMSDKRTDSDFYCSGDSRRSLYEQKTPSGCPVPANSLAGGSVISERESEKEISSVKLNLPRAPHNSMDLVRPPQGAVLAERLETEGAYGYQQPVYQQTSMIPIEDFQFRKWLGQGSFGKVFMAEHKKTGKKVAIKMMEKLHICYNQMTESLFLERDILRLSRNSRNPFLVSLVCAFQREHHVYIAMEFAAGGSLASHLGNGALPHTSTLFYSACIVLGIKFLHENRIVHR
ncbi:hypothetical protein XENTR_v10000127 [Xenopus tropicalis]|nr:hypothetical protein XENTR_v10000127 [Xenopus tropicalis]